MTFGCTSAGNTDSDTPQKRVIQESFLSASELGFDWQHLIIQNAFLNDILLGSIWKLFQRFGIPNSCFWKEVSKKKNNNNRKVTDGVKSETNFKTSQILF